MFSSIHRCCYPHCFTAPTLRDCFTHLGKKHFMFQDSLGLQIIFITCRLIMEDAVLRCKDIYYIYNILWMGTVTSWVESLTSRNHWKNQGDHTPAVTLTSSDVPSLENVRDMLQTINSLVKMLAMHFSLKCITNNIYIYLQVRLYIHVG